VGVAAAIYAHDLDWTLPGCGRSAGRLDPGLARPGLVLATVAAFAVLAVVDAPALAYLVAAVVAVGLLLVSAVDGCC
jgi:hypothetical protein